jgi:hypothetical protein
MSFQGTAMLVNIHNEESLRIRNKKFSSEWPFTFRKSLLAETQFWLTEKVYRLIYDSVLFMLNKLRMSLSYLEPLRSNYKLLTNK